MNDDITVVLGPISLHDAKATRIALQVAIDSGYFWNAENYAAVIQVKSQLQVRIAKAEKTAAFVEPA